MSVSYSSVRGVRQVRRLFRSATIFGTPMRYTACVTENTGRSPWESLAESKGYAPDDNVITCAMVESPRLCYDDVSQEPERLLTGIADSMAAMSSWNMHVRSDMVVAMGPEQATICARAGLSRADVHARLIALAQRAVGDLKRGGNWRRERALKINVDPDNDAAMVPVIKDADKKGILQISQEMSELAKKARDGKLSPAEMQGGCFSISSLGGIGGKYFTPIIHAPEVAIMGVCKSTIEPKWDGKAFQPRLMLPLSLSYDHRVIDGAAAAKFNAYLAALLADFRRALV